MVRSKIMLRIWDISLVWWMNHTDMVLRDCIWNWLHKRWFFTRLLKSLREAVCFNSLGRVFHRVGAATRKDLLPKQVLHRGTWSCPVCLVLTLWACMSLTVGSGNNQSGVFLLIKLCIIVAISSLYFWLIFSHPSSFKKRVTWSLLAAPGSSSESNLTSKIL